ncbi:hypothetical protein FRC12_008480 [Ceratobasidium sp. 428]|nr:hypothetical protein FRC12_008480 [Ceratobasidium sp. 428]
MKSNVQHLELIRRFYRFYAISIQPFATIGVIEPHDPGIEHQGIAHRAHVALPCAVQLVDRAPEARRAEDSIAGYDSCFFSSLPHLEDRLPWARLLQLLLMLKLGTCSRKHASVIFGPSLLHPTPLLPAVDLGCTIQ